MKRIGEECSAFCSDPVNSQYLELFVLQQCELIEAGDKPVPDTNPPQDTPVGDDENLDGDDDYLQLPDGDSVSLDGRDTTNGTLSDSSPVAAVDDNPPDPDVSPDTPAETTADTAAEDFPEDIIPRPEDADIEDSDSTYADKWANYMEIFNITPETGARVGDMDPMNPSTHPLSVLVNDGDDDDDDDMHDSFDHTPYYQHENDLTFSPEDEAKLVRLAKELLDNADEDVDTLSIWTRAKERVLAERLQQQQREEPNGDAPEILNGSNLLPVPGSDHSLDSETDQLRGVVPGTDGNWVDGPTLESSLGPPMDVTSGYDKDAILDVPEDDITEGDFQTEVEPIQPGDVNLNPDLMPNPPPSGLEELELTDGYFNEGEELPPGPDDHAWERLPHSYNPKVDLSVDGEEQEEPVPEPVITPEEPMPEDEIEHDSEPEPLPISDHEPDHHEPGPEHSGYESEHPETEDHPEEEHHEPESNEHHDQYEEHQEEHDEEHHEGYHEEHHEGYHEEYQEEYHEEYHEGAYDEHHVDEQHGHHEEEHHHEPEHHQPEHPEPEFHEPEHQGHHHEHNFEYHEEYHNIEPHQQPEEYDDAEYYEGPSHDEVGATDFHEFPPGGDEYDDGYPESPPDGFYGDGDPDDAPMEGATLADKLRQLYPDGDIPMYLKHEPNGGGAGAYDFEGYDTDNSDVFPGGETPYGSYFSDAFGFSSGAPRLKPFIATFTLGLVVLALFNRDLAPSICFFLGSLSIGLYVYNYEIRLW